MKLSSKTNECNQLKFQFSFLEQNNENSRKEIESLECKIAELKLILQEKDGKGADLTRHITKQNDNYTFLSKNFHSTKEMIDTLVLKIINFKKDITKIYSALEKLNSYIYESEKAGRNFFSQIIESSSQKTHRPDWYALFKNLDRTFKPNKCHFLDRKFRSKNTTHKSFSKK